MQRPEHLPDFTDPPLDEVVVGVQFAPVPSYKSVNAMQIWDPYREKFPKVLEHPILEPQFETFGGMNAQFGPTIHFGAPVGSRIWFLSEDENHILQFQPDRFIANWRRQPNPRPYPRFESIAAAFANNLRQLEEQFALIFAHKIDINQAEIGYINIIPVEDFSEVSDWFRMWNSSHLDTESLNANFNEVIKDEASRPFARLRYYLQSVFSEDGKSKAYRMSLTYRGKPAGSNLSAAMEFIERGREAIVQRLSEITTDKAHKVWGEADMMATTQFVTTAFQHEKPNYQPSYEIVSTLTNGNLFVPVARNDSQWDRKLESRFIELTGLPVGWDGYQGKPVSLDCARFAVILIKSIFVRNVPAPQLVPGSDGTLQLEWHLNGYDIEIDVFAPFEVVATRYDYVTHKEDEIEVESDFSELAEWVKALREMRDVDQVVENRVL